MAAGGGAWKVAYADFVTAMMAFFLVMWITSQNDDVKKAIGGYFQDPWGIVCRKHDADDQVAHRLEGRRAVCRQRRPAFCPTLAAVEHRRTPPRSKPGAASVWQQKHKVHLLANTTAICRRSS